MAEINRSFNGLPFEEGLAKWAPVTKEIHKETRAAGRRGKAIMANHRQEGHAFVTTYLGPVDGLVVLNDERGQKAAMSIEFGRGPADPTDEEAMERDPFPGGTEGIYVLHQATGLDSGKGKNRLNHFPHSKRKKKRR